MNGIKDFQSAVEQAAELGERLRRRREDMAEAAARDAGFPVKITLTEADLGTQHLQTMEEELDLVRNGAPYGTVACIFPYDAPSIMLARLGGSAMLSGNRLLFSFSSWTPRCAAVVEDISAPFKSLEPVRKQDNREFGRRCVVDDDVRVLFISGSSAVGHTYRKHHQAFDKLFFAGPGGMPAALVFPDADPEAAARFIARRAFINGGQYCTTLKKALVHSSLYAQVRDKVLELAGRLKVGDPLDMETDIGPILVERTVNILRYALEQCTGASLLHGGIDGQWVHPIVLEMDRPIPDLELFGPFLVFQSFEDSEEISREITDTRYGFLLVTFGTPPEEASKSFREHFGMVYSNPDFTFTPLRWPFGGRKDSGWILEKKGEAWTQRDGGFLYSGELVRRE